MKRCPQCEFIYEDDQSLCDMDGVLLVFDSRTLPNANALTTVTTKPSPKRNRAVPAFATLILALVLGMVYFVSTQRKAAQTAYTPAAVETSANPAPVESPVQVSTPEPEPQPPVEEPKTSATKPPAAPVPAAPVKKASTTSKVSTSSQTKPVTEEKKEDSKVGSILKKTGRILKKPFKF
jgi:outer membrane biosynthesis protein TonB